MYQDPAALKKSFLSLRSTTFIVITALFLVLVVSLYGVLQYCIIEQFKVVEHGVVVKDIARVRNAITAEFSFMDTLLRTWSAWKTEGGRLYGQQTASTSNSTFQSTNDQPSLNLILSFDANGHTVRTYGLDPETGRSVAAPNWLLQLVQFHIAAFRFTEAGQTYWGVDVSPSADPIFIASRSYAIHEEGEAVLGSLMYIRSLDAEFLQRVSDRIEVDFHIMPLDSSDLPDAVRQAFYDNTSTVVMPYTEQALAGFALFPQALGDANLVFRVVLPRTLVAQALSTIRFVMLSLSVAAVFFGLLFLLFFEYKVLSRIRSLTQQIAPAAGAMVLARVDVSGGDEIRTLADGINAMLERIERAETAIRTSEMRYRALFEQNPDPVVLVDAETGNLVHVNDQAFWQLFPDVDPLGIPFSSLFAASDTKGQSLLSDTLRAGALTRETVIIGHEMQHDVIVSARRLELEKHPFIIVILRDITERNKAKRRVKELTGRLILAQENERLRISRDLHDNVAQDLSSLRITCETMVDGVDNASPIIKKRIIVASAILHKAIASVRNLAYGLRPPNLDRLGLAKTVIRHCEEFQERTGIDMDVSCIGIDELKLDFETEINLYRLLQEALNNIKKHAKATHVTVRLVASFPMVLLRIEDNGIGFLMESLDTSDGRVSGMGLDGMRERAEVIGGSFNVTSIPGKGTRIFAQAPIGDVNQHE